MVEPEVNERSGLLIELTQRARLLGEAEAPGLEGLDEAPGARRALAARAAKGLTGYTGPEAHGGATVRGWCEPGEVSVVALCTLRSELADHSAMLDVMLVMQGLGSYALARSGTDALRQRELPAVAAGERIAAFGLTEPGAGSDLSQVATRAERSGSGWKLTGRKTFISNAGLADFYTLLARTAGEPGDREALTMFHVPGEAVSVERFEVIGPHPIGEVILEGVELGDEHRIGEEGGGLAIALGVLGRFRTSVAAAANGFARRALHESLAHLKRREQFGRPLSAFQGLRFDLAEMDTRLRAAELLVREAATAVETGLDSTAQVARAKLFATESACWIADRAVQHHGGLGVKRGTVVERIFRDVRALRIYEGTSEVQKLILAKALLES